MASMVDPFDVAQIRLRKVIGVSWLDSVYDFAGSSRQRISEMKSLSRNKKTGDSLRVFDLRPQASETEDRFVSLALH